MILSAMRDPIHYVACAKALRFAKARGYLVYFRLAKDKPHIFRPAGAKQ